MADLLRPLLSRLERDYISLPPQTDLRSSRETKVERMDVAQGKLCMGFVTPITNRTPEFASMQVLNCPVWCGDDQ